VDALHGSVFKNDRQRSVVLVGVAVWAIVVAAAIIGLVIGVVASFVVGLFAHISFEEMWDQIGMLVTIGAGIVALIIAVVAVLMLGLDEVMKDTPFITTDRNTRA